jgi:capsular exopolysaccharide synthesis family protein
VDVRAYLAVLRYSIGLILGTTFVVMALAAGATYLLSPVYESTARVYVSSANANPADPAESYAGGLLSQQRVAAYVEIVESDLLAGQVRDRAGVGDTLQSLGSSVTASVVGETPVLEIRFKDGDADRAQLLAQTFAETLVETVKVIDDANGSSGAPVKATIIDPASVPGDPVFPKPLLNLILAAMAGLVLGVALALLRELFDNTIKGVDDLAPTTTPLLGTIGVSAGKGGVLAELDAQDPNAEAFRVLRTNISYVDIDNPTKVLVVTSPMQGEGKTSTAVNLALSLGQTGARTLLIDADLRRPRIAELLRLDGSTGVTTVLLGQVDLEQAVQSTGRDLDVLTSGRRPPNAAELLQSHAMEGLLLRARTLYDVIIIDSPPLLPVTDAALLSAQADGAVVVVRYGRTTRDTWETALDRLEQVDAAALGVVLNMVPSSDVQLAYSYSYDKPPPSLEIAAPGRRHRRRQR